MAETPSSAAEMRILLLNPNSSTTMTECMLFAARSTTVSHDVDIAPMTATTAPASIDDAADIESSTRDILDALESSSSVSPNWDAILVACFSVHTLVPELSARFDVPVTGIFEASVLTALSLLKPGEKWGIVTTGLFWEQHLSEGISQLLGHGSEIANTKLAGVFSSGLTAGDLHATSSAQVEKKLSLATRRLLLSGNVTCVVMGCGAMATLESVIRSTACEVYGQSRARAICIIDGVKAGVMQLHQSINCRRMFQQSLDNSH